METTKKQKSRFENHKMDYHQRNCNKNPLKPPKT